MEIIKKGSIWVYHFWSGRVCLLSNQIAGFFNNQYFRKESVDMLDFLHEDNH